VVKAGRLLLLLAVVASCATTAPHSPVRDLFGVTVDESRTAVHTKLGAIGTLQREERKRQEVWELRDPRFRGAIVGYDADWNVRFITAVAREAGAPVRYADVLDLPAATHRSTGPTHNYRWSPPGAGWTLIAIGNDPDRLTYLTLAKPNEPEEEDDDEH
jgi:hypothetical protein